MEKRIYVSLCFHNTEVRTGETNDHTVKSADIPHSAAKICFQENSHRSYRASGDGNSALGMVFGGAGSRDHTPICHLIFAQELKRAISEAVKCCYIKIFFIYLAIRRGRIFFCTERIVEEWLCFEIGILDIATSRKNNVVENCSCMKPKCCAVGTLYDPYVQLHNHPVPTSTH